MYMLCMNTDEYSKLPIVFLRNACWNGGIIETYGSSSYTVLFKNDKRRINRCLSYSAQNSMFLLHMHYIIFHIIIHTGMLLLFVPLCDPVLFYIMANTMIHFLIYGQKKSLYYFTLFVPWNVP